MGVCRGFTGFKQKQELKAKLDLERLDTRSAAQTHAFHFLEVLRRSLIGMRIGGDPAADRRVFLAGRHDDLGFARHSFSPLACLPYACR